VNPTDRYMKAWQDRRSRIFSVLAMIVIVVAVLQMWPSDLLVYGCIAGGLLAIWRLYDFRCPRCGERFMTAADIPTFWSRRHCQSCTLERDTVPKEPTR
jgi:hypothetical protein